jgi:hypothetical protein
MFQERFEVVFLHFTIGRLNLFDVTAIGTFQRPRGGIEIEFGAAIRAGKLAPGRRRLGHRRRFGLWRAGF